MSRTDGRKAALRCSQQPDWWVFFYSKEVISPDFWYVSFWCTVATFSIAVTSRASDRWHSSSQEEPREHIHLRPSSSRTTSTDITPHPHPCLISPPFLAFFTCYPDFSTHLAVSHLSVSDETSLFLSVTHSLHPLHMEEKPPDNERASWLLTVCFCRGVKYLLIFVLNDLTIVL